MLQLPEGPLPVVVADTQAALEATDRALLANAQMMVSLLQGADGVSLPVALTQPLYAALAEASGKVIEGRASLGRSIRMLAIIKDRSNLAPVATGCPDGVPDAKELARLGATEKA